MWLRARRVTHIREITPHPPTILQGSIIQYSKPADIRKELNDHFREAHSSLDPSLTLSQLRNMKEHLITITMSQDMELSSAAMSFVYFEKLVLKVGVSCGSKGM
jgi:hypothetical protein